MVIPLVHLSLVLRLLLQLLLPVWSRAKDSGLDHVDTGRARKWAAERQPSAPTGACTHNWAG